MENYHKAVSTAIIHSSHHVKATDFKKGQLLTETLCNQNKKIEKASFIANISYNLFPFRLTVGLILLEILFEDISITFFTEVSCFSLFILSFTIPFISTYDKTFKNRVITQCKTCSRQLDRWYQVSPL